MDKKTHRLTPARAALAGLALGVLPMASFAFVSVGVSITVAPPALPVYVQPPCPAVGYIWTPGYWAYGDDDYYWVPGTWVLAPSPGLLWTPGYWGWGGGLYAWHEGYWGPHVGFYGGVNYGYGYGGVGFAGGYWRGGAFFYNRSVSNLGGIHVTNVYNRTVINNYNVTRVSFNGGQGGLRARPNAHELSAEHDHHVAFTSMQREHEHTAFGNHDLRASVNRGKPRIAATERPGVFSGRGVVAARAGAPYHGGNEHGGPGRGPDTHGGDHGGPGRGGPDHVANRNDRPPGAAGSAEVRGGAGRGADVHAGGPGGTRGGPGAGGGGSPASGGHNEQPRVAVAHNDRPIGADGGAQRGPQPRINQGNQMHNMTQGPRPGGSAQPSPHQFGGGGGGQPGQRPQAAPRPEVTPHPQAAPRQQAAARPQATPRAEAAPHQQAAPRPQNAPRPEAHRGGGEPHGQGRPQAPQGRGQNEQNHGRR